MNPAARCLNWLKTRFTLLPKVGRTAMAARARKRCPARHSRQYTGDPAPCYLGTSDAWLEYALSSPPPESAVTT